MKTVDPETKIWPIKEWGSECGRGFVGNARFAGAGDRVIPNTNRETTRKWLASKTGRQVEQEKGASDAGVVSQS